jgi:hypothetical protein
LKVYRITETDFSHYFGQFDTTTNLEVTQVHKEFVVLALKRLLANLPVCLQDCFHNYFV